MKTNWKAETPSLVVLALMWGLVAWAWGRVPDHMPVHFGASGAADRIGGRGEGLLLTPSVTSFFYVLLLAWPHLDPRKERFAQFVRPYRLVRLAVLAFFLVLQATTVAIALGSKVNIDGVTSAAAGIAIALLGNYLPKIQPNWIIGVRTPWTLSSDLSWQRTHRLAGPMLVASGILTLITALVRPGASTYVMLTSLLLTGLVSAVYSYLVWRRDPARGSDRPQKLMS